MDEMKGRPIPQKAPLFGRKAGDVGGKTANIGGGTKLVDTFVNGDGTKAVNLVMVEENNGKATKLTHAGLVGYANELMNGGEDDRDLMVGKVYNGDNAEADAKKEAGRLDEELNPGEDATDEELIEAADDAVNGANEKPEAPVKPPVGEKPVGGLGKELPRPSFGNFAKEPEKKKTPVEDEPMLQQLKGGV